MTSVEATVKAQFAKVFTAADSTLFKQVAEINLREAAELLTTDISGPEHLHLLMRNARKPLLIGIGVELLLKAIYLKEGYFINSPRKGIRPFFPMKFARAAEAQYAQDETISLNKLIQGLSKVVVLNDAAVTERGLAIAKVFRNKEGHSVTASHAFDPTNYTDIAASLVNIYRDVFAQSLSVRFSMVANEPAIWKIGRLRSAAATH